MKTLITLLALFALSYSQIIRTVNQSDTTSVTNGIQPFQDVFPCNCDYLANSCDQFCCCDTDCLEATRNSWAAQELCTASDKAGSLFQKCPDESLLASLVSPKSQQDVGIQQYSTIFCIDYEMVPYAGYFFVENNGTTSGNVLIHGSTTSTTTSATVYSRDMNVYSTPSGSTSPVSRFPIPKANPFGMCENTYSASYLNDLQTTPCTRQVTLTSACAAGSILSTTYYTTTLISAYPSQTTSSVTITTGNIIRTNAAAAGDTTIAQVADTSISANGCRCDNAVAAVEYYVTYNTDGNITAVRADFTLQSIVSSDCTVSTALDQSFGVYFQTVSGATAAIPRSGNPGYIIGLPLLVGTNLTTSINRLIGGFKIRGISTIGTCTTPTNDYSAYRDDAMPKFGMNTSLTCYLDVTTQALLTTYCNAAYISQNIMLYQNFGTDKSVGRFGSSNIHYIDDWIPIEQPTTPLASFAVDSTATSCSLPDEEIYIFYAEFGLSSSPQNYIVKVARRFNINRTFNYDSTASTNYLQFTQTFKYIKISAKDL